NRIQHFQCRPAPASTPEYCGNTISRRGAKIAGLLQRRSRAYRDRKSIRTSCRRECRYSCESRNIFRRCPRTPSHSARRRGPVRKPSGDLGLFGPGDDEGVRFKLRITGNSGYTSGGYRRAGINRYEQLSAGIREVARGHVLLLFDWLSQQQSRARWTFPPDYRTGQKQDWAETRLSPRLLCIDRLRPCDKGRSRAPTAGTIAIRPS